MLTYPPYKKLTYQLFLLIVLGIGLYLRAKDFGHDIDGRHVLRQAHVASNIEYFLKNGISTVPDAYTQNIRYKIYDFPVYQQIIALICSQFSTSVIQTARFVNLIIYCLTFLVFYQILNSWQLNRRSILSVLLLYACSPLGIFFNRAILPDNLAIYFAFQSLWCFVRWQNRHQHSPNLFAYGCMVITGCLATLIKNPVYLLIVITIIMWYIFHHKIKEFFSPGMLFLGTVILMTVVIFKLYANYINVGSLHTPAWDYSWYFATFSQRLQIETYMRIINRFFFEIVSPPVFILALSGLFIYIFEKRNQSEKAVIVGLLIGAIFTILLFLNVNSLHEYYQLPYVFPVCFLAGYFIDKFFSSFEEKIRRYTRFHKVFISLVVMSLFWLSILQITRFYMFSREEPFSLINRGKFIQAHTSKNAFILYLVSGETPENPMYLYFAKRQGYNVGTRHLTSSQLQQIVDTYQPNYETIYLYIPSELFSEVNDLNLFTQEKGHIDIRAAEKGYLIKL